MKGEPDEVIFEVRSAELNWAKRWKKMKSDNILNVVTYISQHNGRIMGRSKGSRR